MPVKTNSKPNLSTPRKKRTYLPNPLPAEGFVRLISVLAVLGISRTSFYNGVKAGVYPPGKLISPRCRVYSVEQIRELIAKIGSES